MIVQFPIHAIFMLHEFKWFFVFLGFSLGAFVRGAHVTFHTCSDGAVHSSHNEL